MKRSELLATLPILGVMVVGEGATRTELHEQKTATTMQAAARKINKRHGKRWVIVHVGDRQMPWWHVAGDSCGLCDGTVGRPAITWYDGELPTHH